MAWRTILGEQVPRCQNLKSTVDWGTLSYHLKHRGGGSAKPFAQSDAAPALPRIQTLSVMMASGLEPQDS